MLVVFKGQVCDVTAFVQRHPGGAAALRRNQGTDVTEKFSAIGHSDAAEAMVESMFICSVDDWRKKHGKDFPQTAEEEKELPVATTGETATPARPEWASIPSEADHHQQSCEFHCQRRKEMLLAYPEIQKLYAPSCVPLLYMPICFFSFILVGYWVGNRHLFEHVPSYLDTITFILASWIIMPFFTFGLNNGSHEICHGNTWLPSSSAQVPSRVGIRCVIGVVIGVV